MRPERGFSWCAVARMGACLLAAAVALPALAGAGGTFNQLTFVSGSSAKVAEALPIFLGYLQPRAPAR